MSPQYLAGLVDGEGYLGLIPCIKRGSINTSYQCVIKLCLTGMNAKEVITQIAKDNKGHVYKRSKPTATGKVVYTVEIKSKPRIKELLDKIQPYMLVKKEQATLMREFVNLPMLHPRHGSFDKSLFDRREAIAKEMKSMTQRIPLVETE